MASRFTQWMEEFTELQKKVEGLPLISIKEVLSVGGEHFILSLGKESGIACGDNVIAPAYMRPYFTSNKDEFYDVMDILKEKIAKARAFSIEVVNALTEEAVPEVVMARMRGEQVSGDAFDMLRTGTIRKLDELARVAVAFETPFISFAIRVEDVAGRTLGLACSGGISTITWGKLQVKMPASNPSGCEHTEGDLEEDMFFLSNFKFVLKALEELGEKLVNVLK